MTKILAESMAELPDRRITERRISPAVGEFAIVEYARLKAVNAELVAALTDCAFECERAGNAIGRANSPLVAGGLLDKSRYARAALAKVRS